MSRACTTEELRGLAEAAICQAEAVLAAITELATLVEGTGVELSAATRRELECELHACVLALHAVRLGVCEPHRGGLGRARRCAYR